MQVQINVQVITVLLTLWLGMVFILEGCALQLVSTPSFVVSVSCINRESIKHLVFRDFEQYMSAGIIHELLLARSGLGVISSLSVADMDFIIRY